VPSLDPARPYKPLDFGNGIVSGSVSGNGRLLSLGMTHSKHGRVVLSATPPFEDDRAFDEQAVRRYRAALAAPDRPGFGFGLGDAAGAVSLIAARTPSIKVRLGDRAIEIVTVAPPGRSGVLQLARGGAGLTVDGDPWLARAAYTELTPGGRLPAIPSSGLTAAFAVRRIDRGDDAYLAIAIAPTADGAKAEAEAVLRDGASTGEETDGTEEADFARDRALAYCLDCAACRLDDGTVAIVADHEILPLVWTRDAYYVARALALLRPADASARTTVAAFVHWLFERAERVDGWWPRASLAGGDVKDPQFQLDQQLYPMLLAAETGRYVAEARELLERVLSRRGPNGLIATSETPADDPIALPYHFSSHVLLWRVLSVFEHPEAPRLQKTVRRAFLRDGRFAYATAADGGVRHYHDANDLPTVFAPGWGFCRSDDPAWRATVEFAWSEANPGYFAGPFGGLGSLHTPHPWPLGDLQEIVVARLVHDRAREERAVARLDTVETWDSMLPEAYDEHRGDIASRHWFAWPNALRALLLADRERVTP
jgi:uncharacterized protein